MSETTTSKKCFIVYMIGDTHHVTSVSRNATPDYVDNLLKGRGNWYATEHATNKEQAIYEALAGGFASELNIVWEQGKSPVIQG